MVGSSLVTDWKPDSVSAKDRFSPPPFPSD